MWLPGGVDKIKVTGKVKTGWGVGSGMGKGTRVGMEIDEYLD